MKKNRAIRWTLGMTVLIILTAVFFLLEIAGGTADLSLGEVLRALTDDEATAAHIIVMNIRLPRAIAAALLGGALAVSGFLLQTFFNNPIAGPYVLGISSGAKLMVALLMVFSLSQGFAVNSFGMVTAAFIGSMISMGIILLISGKVKRMSVLIVCGVMIGYICSAITDLIVAFADDSNIVNLHNWSMGSFSGMDWGGVLTCAIVVVLGLICAIIMSKPMGAYQLGEDYARNMGVNVKLFRVALIILSSILSACVTAFAGPISFVGIAVPHLIKNLFGTSKPLVVIPACFLGGSVFCLLCDLIARTLFAPTELSISSVTAIFGVPVVIWMLLTRQKSNLQ